MSVVHFESRELATLILGLCDAKTLVRELALSVIHGLCDAKTLVRDELALSGVRSVAARSCLRYELAGIVAYSKANTAAYRASYPKDGAEEVTEDDLMRDIMATIEGGPSRIPFATMRKEAIERTLCLMSYNAIDRWGHDHLEGNIDAARAIIDLQKAAIRLLLWNASNVLHGRKTTMDPQACYQKWLDAVKRKDRTEALEAHTDLSRWLRMGGFSPEWSSKESATFHAWRSPPFGSLWS